MYSGRKQFRLDKTLRSDKKLPEERYLFQPKLEILPVISRLIKEKNGKARAIISGDQILELKEQDDRPVLMAAFDIGTTTVAGYLLDGKTGEQLATASALNTQTEYGADVIMRANYSLEHGTEELSTCIRELLRKLIGTLCEAAKNLRRIFIRSVLWEIPACIIFSWELYRILWFMHRIIRPSVRG